MELRKVQRTNSGTFFVTLPKNWAERFGLSKGAILSITESIDGHLSLSPQSEMERRILRAVIRPTPYLYREIVGKYLLGYDEIRVEAKNNISLEERTLIKETSSRLIGLEIVEEDYARIVLQCLLEPTASSPEKILRREYNIAAWMHRDGVTAFLEGDRSLAQNVIARDVEVNRFYFLLVRTLRAVIQNPSAGEKFGIHSIDCLDYRLCGSLVETIGDRAVEIAHKGLISKGGEIPRTMTHTIEMFHSDVFNAQETALKAFFARNVALAEEVRNKRGKIETMFREIELSINKRSAEFVPMILAVASSIYRIFSHSVDIADLVMPREPRRGVKM